MDELMETKTHRVGPASLRVRQCNALPLYMRDSTREICNVEVPYAQQRQGYATTLMHRVCREADAANMVLMLWPQPFGDNIAMSRTQLADWYAREFGFVVTQPEPMMMARLPGATPRLLRLNKVTESVVSA